MFRGRRLGVVFAGGHGSTPETIWEPGTHSRALLDAITTRYRVTVLDNSVDEAVASLRCRQVVLIGGSLGAVALLNWASDHRERVAGFIGLVPVLDVDDVIDYDRGGLGADLASRRTQSPMRHTEAFTFPIRIYWRPLDHIIPPEVTHAFASRVPCCELVELPGGHGNPWWPDDLHDQLLTFIASARP
jgi:pimeloyl-ACP methyl ester carboxylesterase